MPIRWIPGMQRNEYVRTKYTLPLMFKNIEPRTYKDLIVYDLKLLDTIPFFPGCNNSQILAKKNCSEKAMYKYLSEVLIYPEEAKQKGIEGIVNISFVVMKDGSLQGFEIEKNIGSGCGKAALAAFESMSTLSDRWEPGIHKGVPVNVLVSFPIYFIN